MENLESQASTNFGYERPEIVSSSFKEPIQDDYPRDAVECECVICDNSECHSCGQVLECTSCEHCENEHDEPDICHDETAPEPDPEPDADAG